MGYKTRILELGGQNPDDPNHSSQDNAAEIARYQAAIQKQVAQVLALVNSTPNLDPATFEKVADYLGGVSNVIDLTSAVPAI